MNKNENVVDKMDDDVLLLSLIFCGIAAVLVFTLAMGLEVLVGITNTVIIIIAVFLLAGVCAAVMSKF